MDVTEFWRLVDGTRGQENRAEVLAKLLDAHSPEEIIAFRIVYDDLINAANRVDLWGAAHTINGSCSDDEFFYFREALIEMGRPVFDAAVKDPDSLADVANPGEPIAGAEGLANAPMMAWTAMTGKSEEDFYEAVDSVDRRSDRGDAEEGEWWRFDDKAEVRYRLPRLAAKFLASEE